MNILLIGGGGYLGVPLSNNLISNGHNVVVFDKFKYNTEDLINCKKIIGDVGAIIQRSDFHALSFDIIFYLAQSRLDELTTEKQVEIEIEYFRKFINSFDYSKNIPIPKIFFISSCSVYGSTEDIVNEKSPIKITSLYSKMKIICENILLEKGNSKFKILRLSTLYGMSNPYRGDTLINMFVDEIKNDKILNIYDPNTKRPHLHVNDCVLILSALINIDFKEQILNIGSNELNVSKFEIINMLKSFKDFQYTLMNESDPRNYCVNFDLLSSHLNFKPQNFMDVFSTLQL